MRPVLLRFSRPGAGAAIRFARPGVLGVIALTGCSLVPFGTDAPGDGDHFVSPLQAAHIDTVPLVPAQARTGGTARFIVKIKGVEPLEGLTRLWYKDRDAAQARYQDWAGDQAVFDGLKLDHCTYSGEVVLRRDFSGNEPSGEAAVNAILERIRGHPRVAYADPEFNAHPGLKGD